MRALQITELSGSDGLELVELPEPPADGNVVVELRAAGVSFPDPLPSRGLCSSSAVPSASSC